MSSSFSSPPVVCVCGCKKSGKTLLVSRLVRYFSDRGLAVGTIKHDGHDFDLDREGTDSWRHRAAGAQASAVFSSRRWAVFRDGEPEWEALLKLMADMDLILVEGLKGSPWPKILVLGREPVLVAPPFWAVVGEGGAFACPRFGWASVRELADFLLGALALER